MAINPSSDVLRAARALLSWSQRQIAVAARVSRPTINRLESGGNATVETVEAIVQAYEQQGVEFTGATMEHGVGVRWRTPAGRIGEDPAEDDVRKKG
ncbi:helix-turn-helix domain-containing protein [Rhizobium sp. Leaf453]|uniref:helix-turn-helix transcriptional regulator n=1 Tax=Rhizobium sp. Leaf453 TaxID=1736380 RepID=UPI0009EBA3AB